MTVAKVPASLVEKYDRPVPRYTSYPPIPYWEAATPEAVQSWLEEGGSSGSLSLYTHIPFCEERCWYCGCFVVVTRHAAPVQGYLDTVLHEMALVRRHLPPGHTVRQYHLGGGTPTALRMDGLTWLVENARALFEFEPELEMSIELDPRHVNGENLAHLRGLGFNRLSFGVQDLDPVVQAEVNRELRLSHLKGLMETARALEYSSVNFDLIYGLPGQNRERFTETIAKVAALRPQRLAIYNFAYLPETFPHQRKLAAAKLPDRQERIGIILEARTQLQSAGYEPLGMDHFALAQDSLAVACRAGTLHRNFMGYTARAGRDLLAFGVSGISEFGGRYWQNEKKLARYLRTVESGTLPVVRGLALSPRDRLRQAAISDLFCRGRISFADLEQRFGGAVREDFAAELAALAPLANDGLVEVTPGEVAVTELGRHFLRNIAVVFDDYAKRGKAPGVRFSGAV